MCLKWEDEWLACLSSLRFWDLTSFLPPFSTSKPSWSGTFAQFLDGGMQYDFPSLVFRNSLTVSEISLLSNFFFNFSYCFDCSYLCFSPLLPSFTSLLVSVTSRSDLSKGSPVFPLPYLSAWSTILLFTGFVHWTFGDMISKSD